MPKRTRHDDAKRATHPQEVFEVANCVMSVELRHVVDIICLVYHEARNIRHPIKAGKFPSSSKYIKFRNLPKNRSCAWHNMSKMRIHAVDSGTIWGARDIFENFFGVSLRDLVALYRMPIWKHSACGGNRWADISSKVCDLVDAMTSDDRPIIEDTFREIISMCHNTGRVGVKLRDLTS